MKKITFIGVAINIAISIAMFCLIFYSYAGVSGGDMAIMLMNVIFGLIQIFVVAIWGRITKRLVNSMILTIVISQILEIVFFVHYGYEINEWLKR